MRLLRFGPVGREESGILHGGLIAPLARLDQSWAGIDLAELLREGDLDRLRGYADTLERYASVPVESVRLGSPLGRPGKIICVGLNYKGHADEQGSPHPEEPLLFCKSPTALAGPNDPIVLPGEDCKPDYEVELAVVIGKTARKVGRNLAHEHIAGFMVGNDVSGRKWQKNDGQWFRAKSCDTFYPCGPYLVTADEIDDYRNLQLTTHIDGVELQHALADDLIHDVPALIAYISRHQTLEPGDIISTGTPAGVGCYREPRRFLQPGEVVTCAISGLGELINPVVADQG